MLYNNYINRLGTGGARFVFSIFAITILLDAHDAAGRCILRTLIRILLASFLTLQYSENSQETLAECHAALKSPQISHIIVLNRRRVPYPGKMGDRWRLWKP